MNYAIKSLPFYQGVKLNILRSYLPDDATTFQDIIKVLEDNFSDEEAETKIVKTSKSTFEIRFEKGLCVWAVFKFSTATKTIKRLC